MTEPTSLEVSISLFGEAQSAYEHCEGVRHQRICLKARNATRFRGGGAQQRSLTNVPRLAGAAGEDNGQVLTG